MTVLVTGATGLLGSHIVELLVARGDHTRALVRPNDDARELVRAGVDIRLGDLRDSTALQDAVDGAEYVVNCAARTGPWGPDSEFTSTNVNALEAAIRASLRAGVRRFVHVSSITVHGNDVRGTADESFPLRGGSNPYSRSKVEGERLVQHMVQTYRAPVTIVRPGWIYGPRDSASFARFAGLIRTGKMPIIGSGRNHLPLIYVTDAALGVLQAATLGADGTAYLLVNDEPVTQLDFLQTIATEIGVPAPKRRIPYAMALTAGALLEAHGRLSRRTEPPLLTRYGLQLLGGENRFNITRARQELGFFPEIGVANGVKQSVDWYRGVSSGSES